jgi:IMP dehydrogenase/GMP reductase
VQFRYDDPSEIIERVIAAPDDSVQDVLAEAYLAPIREELIARRITELHDAGSKAALSATPGIARTFGPFAAEQGADLFLVQSQVSSARHLATGYEPLALAEFTRFMPIPVAVGNTTNAEAAFLLMEQGAAAIFVGVGPGAACTTREVLGIGIPQVTAICDVAAARDAYLAETGRYVPVVADGGMKRGGDIAKAIASGADVVMLGSPLARAAEAPGRGTNWGHGRPVAGPAARDADQGRHGRTARADPQRAVARHRRHAEPHRGAAPVDGGPRGSHDRRDARARDRYAPSVSRPRASLAAEPLNSLVVEPGRDRRDRASSSPGGGRSRFVPDPRARTGSGQPARGSRSATTRTSTLDPRRGGRPMRAVGPRNPARRPSRVSSLIANDDSGPFVAEEMTGAERNAAIASLILRYGTPAEGLGRGPAFRLRRVSTG